MQGRYFIEQQQDLALGGSGEQYKLPLTGGEGGTPDRLQRRDLEGRFAAMPRGRTVQTPISRATDPEGSHQGAAAAAGSRQNQIRQVAAHLRAKPGYWTAQEIARDAGMCRYVVGRRLSEAVTAGLVKRGAQRHCSVTGVLVGTWTAI